MVANPSWVTIAASVSVRYPGDADRYNFLNRTDLPVTVRIPPTSLKFTSDGGDIQGPFETVLCKPDDDTGGVCTGDPGIDVATIDDSLTGKTVVVMTLVSADVATANELFR